MKSELIEIFKDTLHQCRTNQELKTSVQLSRYEQKFYDYDVYPVITTRQRRNTDVQVNRATTMDAARKWKKTNRFERIGILNFASATSCGGGVLYGAQSQEESLCRTSTLYSCLDIPYLHSVFYEYNQKHYDCTYSDALIYTPDVTVFKSDDPFPQQLERKDWIQVDVITCAAPNNFYQSLNDNRIFNLQYRRAKHILHIAAAHHIDTLILGAFGCGVFRNKACVAADAWKHAIIEFGGYFKHIDFAIYEHVPYKKYNAFSVLEGLDISEVESLGSKFNADYLQPFPAESDFPTVEIIDQLYTSHPYDCLINVCDASLHISDRFLSSDKAEIENALSRQKNKKTGIAYETYGFQVPVARIYHIVVSDNQKNIRSEMEDAFELACAGGYRRVAILCDQMDPTVLFPILQYELRLNMGFFTSITLISDRVQLYEDEKSRYLEFELTTKEIDDMLKKDTHTDIQEVDLKDHLN